MYSILSRVCIRGIREADQSRVNRRAIVREVMEEIFLMPRGRVISSRSQGMPPPRAAIIVGTATISADTFPDSLSFFLS